MRVAVTGGTGFLGRPLVEALLANGHSVRVLSRAGAKAAVPAGATAAFFDAEQPLASGTLDGIDAVMNLAGETISKRWTPAYKERLRTSRVPGTRALAEAVRGSAVRAFVSASAVGYYGPRGAEEVDESAPAGSDFLGQLCQAWEAAAAPAEAAGARLVTVRIGVVLHPGGGALAKMLPAFKLGVAGRLGSGEQYLPWIHRDDLISLVRFCVERAAVRGPVNATAPQPVTNAEFTGALAHALHRPAVLPAPAFALRLALGEMSDVVLTGQRAVPKKALAAGFTFAHPSLDGALASLFAR